MNNHHLSASLTSLRIWLVWVLRIGIRLVITLTPTTLGLEVLKMMGVLEKKVREQMPFNLDTLAEWTSYSDSVLIHFLSFECLVWTVCRYLLSFYPIWNSYILFFSLFFFCIIIVSSFPGASPGLYWFLFFTLHVSAMPLCINHPLFFLYFQLSQKASLFLKPVIISPPTFFSVLFKFLCWISLVTFTFT